METSPNWGLLMSSWVSGISMRMFWSVGKMVWAWMTTVPKGRSPLSKRCSAAKQWVAAEIIVDKNR